MLGAALGKEGLDPQPMQDSLCRFGIVGAVGVQLFWPGFRVSWFSLHVRDRHNQGQQLLEIGDICAGDGDRQGNALPIDQYVMLGARSCAVGGIWSRRLATAHRECCRNPRPACATS